MKHEEKEQEANNAFGETEEKARALTYLAGGTDGADREYLTDLTVFLDDALAVEKSEAM